MQRAARVLPQSKSSYLTPPQVKFLSTVLEGLMPKDRSKASRAKCVAAAEVESKEEFFEGLGNIAEAPKYLRINGKVSERANAMARKALKLRCVSDARQVRNRGITKRDTEALIKDMWKCKRLHDKKNAAKGKPPEDIHDYLYM
jgi:hypothetical protein